MIELEKDGVYYRANSADVYVQTEVEKFYNIDCKDKVVLDLGGHIGFSAIKFAKQGARKVYVFEPESENYKLLEKNTRLYDVILPFNSGVVGNPDIKTAKLYVSSFDNTANCSMILTHSWTFREVVCVFIGDVIDEVKPQIIKCDIEGMEYQVFSAVKPVPEYVTDIMMEAHFFYDEHRLMFEDLKCFLLESGFDIIEHEIPGKSIDIEYFHFRRK